MAKYQLLALMSALELCLQVESKASADDKVELAPVLDNSLGWGSFMALSSNIRYQTLNCIEENVLVCR